MFIIIKHTCHSSQRAECSLAADTPYREGSGFGAGKKDWDHLVADTYPVIQRNLPPQHKSLTQFAGPFSWDSGSNHRSKLEASFLLAGCGLKTEEVTWGLPRLENLEH